MRLRLPSPILFLLLSLCQVCQKMYEIYHQKLIKLSQLNIFKLLSIPLLDFTNWNWLLLAMMMFGWESAMQFCQIKVFKDPN